jgi:mannose-6-phosphate isomerase-like protein (cupin superfamily)
VTIEYEQRPWGSFTVLDDSHVARPGDAVGITRGAAHRITNRAADDLVFIEVQHGDSFAKSDIVRLDDDYGRSVTLA